MLVAVAAVGALSYARFAGSAEPLALILREIGRPGVARFLAVSAVIALPTVLLAFLFGQSRIFFTMARDGLLPASLATVSRRGSPVRITLVTAAIVSVIAGLLPLGEIAALANAGTLAAFIAVAVCVLVTRRRDPHGVRAFRTPLAWVVAPFAILGCLYLFWSLPTRTQVWFGLWNLGGLAVYFLYARPRAVAGR
jgi:APA family basic amino acid/polyamine antiporter